MERKGQANHSVIKFKIIIFSNFTFHLQNQNQASGVRSTQVDLLSTMTFNFADYTVH